MVENMKELQRHIDAFEIYFTNKQNGQNVQDSVRLVESKFGVSEKTVYKWKRVFDWDGREAIRANEINRKIEKKTDNSIVSNKVKYLAVVHKPIDDLIKKMNEGKSVLVIESSLDVERYLKMALLLQDQPTDKTDVVSEVESSVKKVNNLFKIAEEGNEDESITEEDK